LRINGFHSSPPFAIVITMAVTSLEAANIMNLTINMAVTCLKGCMRVFKVQQFLGQKCM